MLLLVQSILEKGWLQYKSWQDIIDCPVQWYTRELSCKNGLLTVLHGNIYCVGSDMTPCRIQFRR